MKTTITYKIDKFVIENAVRELIQNGLKINIKNIKEKIQHQVYQNGITAIYFLENWYRHDDEINKTQEEIDEIVSKFINKIK